MTVKELKDLLEKCPDEAVVGFLGNGTWLVGAVEIGQVEGQDTPYCLMMSMRRGDGPPTLINKLPEGWSGPTKH